MNAEPWTYEPYEPENALSGDEREEADFLAGLRERAGEALQELGRLVRLAVELIVLLLIVALPWLFRGATVAFAAWSVSCAYPKLATRLGGDPPAVLLALTLVLLPLAAALGLAQGAGAEPWGAFLAAGAATYILGQLVWAASPLSVAFGVGAGFTGIVIYLVYEATKQNDIEVMEEVDYAEQSSHW